MSGKIYVITCDATGKKYVGLTTATLNRRLIEHKSSASVISKNTKLGNAIRKYGISEFKIELLEEVPDRASLAEREIHWIAKLDTFRAGYNLTSGGEISKEWSDESRAKVSAANKGRIRTDEQKRRRSVASLGRKHTTETKQKMSLWQKGQKKHLISVEKRAEKRRIKMVVHGVFYSGLTAAAKALGVEARTVSKRLSNGEPGYVYMNESVHV